MSKCDRGRSGYEITLVVFRVATVREKPGKNRIFLKGIEKPGNSVSSQGNTKFYLKVSEKAENFVLG